MRVLWICLPLVVSLVTGCSSSGSSGGAGGSSSSGASGGLNSGGGSNDGLNVGGGSSGGLNVGGGPSGGTGNGNPSGGGASLDCTWLAGDNCWKTTASAASSCLPPSAETGVLSADNATCTYASGAVVTFTQPLVLPVPDSPTWNFTIANAGQTCLHYQDTQDGFTLTVGSQTVTEALVGALGLQIQCPGGATYSNANVFALLSCNGGASSFFGDLPGNTYSGTTASITFGLVGTSTTSATELQLFRCAK